MGNILRVPVLGYSGSPRFPCHLQLPSAAIDLSIHARNEDDGVLWECWEVSYTVDGSTCKLILTRHVDQDGNIKALQFHVSDKVHLQNCFFWFIVTNCRTGRLPDELYTISTLESAGSRKTNRTVNNAWGGFTNTKSYVYGRSGNRGDLVVEEEKKNSNDEPFTTLTLAHYFAFKKSTESDIGFSVVAKVRLYNDGKLDVLTVEGPEQHPASSLLYMFDEVFRTGIWKPTMCFHCVQNRRHLSRMLWQESDAEDSDGVPVPPRRASSQNAITVSNNGRFRDGNGNYIENNYMNFRRRWW